jgi:hypothetical protein
VLCEVQIYNNFKFSETFWMWLKQKS